VSTEGGVVTLFDPEEGRRRRDEAMHRAEGGAPVDWVKVAYDAVVNVARSRPEFTSEHVIEYLAAAGTPWPREPRALGAVMNRAAKRRVAFPTDRTMRALRKERHSGTVRIWRSNICGEAAS
jgi:hypothetical protein